MYQWSLHSRNQYARAGGAVLGGGATFGFVQFDFHFADAVYHFCRLQGLFCRASRGIAPEEIEGFAFDRWRDFGRDGRRNFDGIRVGG